MKQVSSVKEVFLAFLAAIVGVGTVRVTGNWRDRKPRASVSLRGTITKSAFIEAVDVLENEDRGVQLMLKAGASQKEIAIAQEAFSKLAEALNVGVAETEYNGRKQFRFASMPVSLADDAASW